MQIYIENLTDNDIDVDGNGFLIIPGKTKALFYDEGDSSTYELGYYIIKYGYTNIAKMIESEDLVVYDGDSVITPSETFLLFRERYYREKFQNTNIKFEPDGCGNMYFSLQENTLKIFNPISGKWYSVQMTEVVS